MSASKEKALKAFRGKHNCSQSVLLGFAAELGLSEQTALRISSGFGGGIALGGNTCGVITGGIMVLGLAGSGVGTSKVETYDKSRLFQSRFEQKFGSQMCKKLIEERCASGDKGFCDKYVEEACIIVEELLNI